MKVKNYFSLSAYDLLLFFLGSNNFPLVLYIKHCPKFRMHFNLNRDHTHAYSSFMVETLISGVDEDEAALFQSTCVG